MAAAKYKLIRKHGHPNAYANGQIREHIFVMSELLGRPLNGIEVVHHIDENPLNNHPGNLQLFATQAEHVKYHTALRVKKHAIAACGDASFMKCPYCKTYSPPSEMVLSKVRYAAHHKVCRNADVAKRRSTPEAKAARASSDKAWKQAKLKSL